MKLYLIHTSSHCCCCKLELDFKVVLQVQVDEELIAVQTLPLCLSEKLKLTWTFLIFCLALFHTELYSEVIHWAPC